MWEEDQPLGLPRILQWPTRSMHPFPHFPGGPLLSGAPHPITFPSEEEAAAIMDARRADPSGGVCEWRRGCVAVCGGGADIASQNPYVGNVGKSVPLKEADFFGTPVF